jgi:hypothetical protein
MVSHDEPMHYFRASGGPGDAVAEAEREYTITQVASHTGMPSYSCRWTVQRINDDDWYKR